LFEAVTDELELDLIRQKKDMSLFDTAINAFKDERSSDYLYLLIHSEVAVMTDMIGLALEDIFKNMPDDIRELFIKGRPFVVYDGKDRIK